MRFLHAADLHIDSPLRGLDRYEGAPVDDVRGATRRAFENLITTALRERVDLVVIGGDLYDGVTKYQRAKATLGGVPKRGIYDNMKTAVDRVFYNHKRRHWLYDTATFSLLPP